MHMIHAHRLPDQKGSIYEDATINKENGDSTNICKFVWVIPLQTSTRIGQATLTIIYFIIILIGLVA